MKQKPNDARDRERTRTLEPGRPPALAGLQPALKALVDRARAVEVRDFERGTFERALGELRPLALELVRDARFLAGEVLARCEHAREGEAQALAAELVGWGLTVDAAIESAAEGERALQAVEDIASLVLLELRQRFDRLTQLDASSTPLMLIGECDSALRRVHKGLAALDTAIARAESVPPQIDFSSELEVSLKVRRAYARFRRRLREGEEPTAADLYPRLRAVGTQLAVLIGREEYRLFRTRDRLQLRELQERILGWLRPEHRTDLPSGLRLWQDLVAFVELLGMISKRQELIEHDRREVAFALRAFAAPADGPLDEVTRAQLLAFDGCDPALDELLASPAATRAAVRDALLQLAARLGVDESGAS